MKQLLILILFIVGTLSLQAQTQMKGIAVYISYPGAPALEDATSLNNLLNDMNYTEVGIQRSFRKYWMDETKGGLDITHDIFFYQAPQPTTFYTTWQETRDMWLDALEHVITNNPSYNWDNLSTDSDGKLSSVMILGSSDTAVGWGVAHYPNWTLSNGKVVRSAYGSRITRSEWVNKSLFEVIHESGHGIFGFPDTYDRDYDSSGASFYSVMSGNDGEVEPVGAAMRAEQNWGNIIEPVVGTQTISLVADGADIVVVRNVRDPHEFFAIEARAQANVGNNLFPSDLGLLIWHADGKVATGNDKQARTFLEHYKYSIEQADGLFELEAGTSGQSSINMDPNDLFTPGTEFSDITTPSTKWWDGTSSNFKLSNISYDNNSNTITFDIELGEVSYDDEIEITSGMLTAPSSGGNVIANAFDNDPNTKYVYENATRPHDVVIDLGETYNINEFYYTSETSPAFGGWVKDYELYVSDDPNNWGTPISGRFHESSIKQYLVFDNQPGRYVKFSSLSPQQTGSIRTTIEEFSLRGAIPPSCTDGIQNGDEEGVDCGGSNCAPCAAAPCQVFGTSLYTWPGDDITACGVANASNAPYQAWTNEGYIIDNLSLNTDYNFNFCTGYDAAVWEGSITVYSLNSDNTVNSYIGFAEGCSIDFTSNGTETSYLCYINDVTDACDAVSAQIDNGTPQIYCIDPVTCAIPTNQSVVMTSTTTAFFDWDDVPGATFYQVRYRLKGTTAWSVSGTAISQRNIPNLLTKRNYQYKIRAQCADGSWSADSEVIRFYTSQCEVPTNLSITFSDANRMRVRWDSPEGEIKGKVRYRVVGSGAAGWQTQNSADGNNFLWVNDLPTNAYMQIRVRSNCHPTNNDWSDYTPAIFHQLGGAARQAQVITETKLSPNPANNVLNLSFNTESESEVNIVVSDNLGKAVLTMNNTYQEGNQLETLDISRLASGYYFITIYSNDTVETLKFIKSK